MTIKVLLVDDEELMLKGLSMALQQEGYETHLATDGQEALNMIHRNAYDLVLLDVMLPASSGLEVCQQIRENSDIPVIMISAKGKDIDKLLGLEYGADDYITKPFNIIEVKSRIKAILRRVHGQPDTHIMQISISGISLNALTRSVHVLDKPVSLTGKEFDLLHMLMEHPGSVFSRNDLLEAIWGHNYLGDFRTIDVHIKRLRDKIEPNPSAPQYVITKWGIGYYFATA